MLLFERELQYHYSEDGILREARAIYSIATARSKNIRICLSNPIYNFDEGRAGLTSLPPPGFDLPIFSTSQHNLVLKSISRDSEGMDFYAYGI